MQQQCCTVALRRASTRRACYSYCTGSKKVQRSHLRLCAGGWLGAHSRAPSSCGAQRAALHVLLYYPALCSDAAHTRRLCAQKNMGLVRNKYSICSASVEPAQRPRRAPAIAPHARRDLTNLGRRRSGSLPERASRPWNHPEPGAEAPRSAPSLQHWPARLLCTRTAALPRECTHWGLHMASMHLARLFLKGSSTLPRPAASLAKSSNCSSATL